MPEFTLKFQTAVRQWQERTPLSKKSVHDLALNALKKDTTSITSPIWKDFASKASKNVKNAPKNVKKKLKNPLKHPLTNPLKNDKNDKNDTTLTTSSDPALNASNKVTTSTTSPQTTTAFEHVFDLDGRGKLVVSFEDVTIKHYTDSANDAIRRSDYDNATLYFTEALKCDSSTDQDRSNIEQSRSNIIIAYTKACNNALKDLDYDKATQYFTEALKYNSSTDCLNIKQSRSNILNACEDACVTSIEKISIGKGEKDTDYQEFKKAANYIENAIQVSAGHDEEFSDVFVNTCIRAFELAMKVRCDDLLPPSNLTNSLSTPGISRTSRIPTEER